MPIIETGAHLDKLYKAFLLSPYETFREFLFFRGYDPPIDRHHYVGAEEYLRRKGVSCT